VTRRDASYLGQLESSTVNRVEDEVAGNVTKVKSKESAK